MVNPERLSAAVLDTLDSQIAVIDQNGKIVYVNQAWRNFAIENGMPVDHSREETNYMAVCNSAAASGDHDGAQVFTGIRSVLENRSACFMFEYPCHSPDEQRWFMMRIAALSGVVVCFVISHHVITERKLAEERIEQCNQALARLAATDKLTQLANRTKLDEVLDNEVYRAGRYTSVFSMILVDVDHFKSVNDRFGHLVGDAVLSGIAEILRTRVRESDVAGRWGGEEFLLLLPGCDEAEARQMAEYLRLTIADASFPDTGAQTCSFGVAAHMPGDTAASLMTRVDEAPYRAKRNGRNRVEIASAEDS
jgi:diguanylate cyclase (GGDEF)-like protein